MEPAILERLLHRQADANKYEFGHVLIIGGMPGMVGAPLLAGEAALRAGAGLVTIASWPEVVDKLECQVREIMTVRIPVATAPAVEAVVSFVQARRVRAVAIGLGQTAELAALDRAVVAQLGVPLVLDGGALGAFGDHLAELKALSSRNHNVVLTPHAGEYYKLTGEAVPAEPAARQQMAMAFADKYNVTLVLKGHRTLVAHPGERVYENMTGNPGMATAGTGDVLSGVVAGLLAQGLHPAKAARAAVYVHGRAGDLAAQANSQPGMIASDVIWYVPAALQNVPPSA